MPRPIDLASHVQKLLQEKRQHTQALTRIDQTLQRIESLLGHNGQQPGGRSSPTTAVGTATVTTAPQARRRRRRRFAVSGTDLILNHVKQRKNPVTRELAELWRSQGRAGKVDNLLSQMVKAGKLKRTPLGGEQRGSRYALA